jgi:hypothetical protein
MRNHIRELREEVRALREGQPTKPAAPKRDGVTSLSADSNVKYISQIQVQVPQRSYRQQNYNRGYNSYFGNGYSSSYGGNNYYYRNNRQPYYYNGSNNWYGNRPSSGIQIGPNLGVYWY